MTLHRSVRLVVALFVVQLTLTGRAEPPTKPTYQQGLVEELYALPRRPRHLRNLLPGMPAKVVKVVKSPQIATDGDLDGNTGNVQVEFDGEIHLPATGDYHFAAEADDGMDLSIDGKPVLANAWINGSNAPSRVIKNFTAGWHPIHIRYYQGDGGFSLRLHWQPPGAAVSEIPADDLRVSDERVAAAKDKLKVDTKAEAADPALSHRAIFRLDSFFELPESDGDLLVDLLEGPTNYSAGARKDFAATLKQTNFQSLPYWHQVMVLSGFLRGWYSEDTARGPVKVRADYTLADAEPFDYDGWHGKKRHGFKTVEMIGNEKFTIYTPAADSVERENVAQAIAGLPPTLRVMLKYVTVEPYGTASEFNGGGDNIWIRRMNATPLGMIDDTFSHEIGHILMNHTDCYLAWQAAIGKDVLSVSHYGRLNPSEDFAEFNRLYLSTNGDESQIASLHRLFPNRMAVMDEALKKVSFSWNQ